MSINSKVVACAFFAVSALGLQSAANAQMSTVNKPFTIKVGDFIPSDDYTRSVSGDSHFELSLSYDLSKTTGSSPFIYGVYGDAIFQTSRDFTFFDPTDTSTNYAFSAATGKSAGYGVGVQGRYLLTDARSVSPSGRHFGPTPYIGAGIGLYDVNIKEDVTDVDTNFNEIDEYGISKNVVGLGGKLALGIQSHSGFMGEVSYQWLPKDYDQNLSGTGVQIGYRF